MFSQKSLRIKYALQLALASTMLVVIISVMLYHYIKITMYENVAHSLKMQAIRIQSLNITNKKNINISPFNIYDKDIQVGFVDRNISDKKPVFEKTKIKNKTFLTLYYPYKNSNICLALKKETTEYTNIINQILADLLIINATALFLIIFYALFLSRMLLMPIKIICLRLYKQNEKFLNYIDEKEIPEEFLPLISSINRLIDRIKTFAQYQKELFVGAAHELKTPLAVMKTKNEVTLLKERPLEKYIEALKNNNQSIDSMNKMITSILEIGRQEGKQLEEPVMIEIISYLRELANNFKILSQQNKIDLEIDFKPEHLEIMVQPTLFMHVIQNFIQNAIKFSEPKSVIKVQSYLKNNKFIIDVLDEGCGIDESKDLFAPFKRYGNKQGAGLGLFLAKGAAQAMGGDIFIKNRKDSKGTISTLSLNISINSKKSNKNS